MRSSSATSAGRRRACRWCPGRRGQGAPWGASAGLQVRCRGGGPRQPDTMLAPSRSCPAHGQRTHIGRDCQHASRGRTVVTTQRPSSRLSKDGSAHSRYSTCHCAGEKLYSSARRHANPPAWLLTHCDHEVPQPPLVTPAQVRLAGGADAQDPVAGFRAIVFAGDGCRESRRSRSSPALTRPPWRSRPPPSNSACACSSTSASASVATRTEPPTVHGRGPVGKALGPRRVSGPLLGCSRRDRVPGPRRR